MAGSSTRCSGRTPTGGPIARRGPFPSRRGHCPGVVVWGGPGLTTHPEPQKPPTPAPGVAFLTKHPAPPPPTPRFCPVAPDLCVEVLSPHDRASELQEKIGMWPALGARLVL